MAAAAVLTKQNSILPRETLDRWESCVQDCDDPAIIRKIVHAAFPELQNAPMEELADVASVLLQKRCVLHLICNFSTLKSPSTTLSLLNN